MRCPGLDLVCVLAAPIVETLAGLDAEVSGGVQILQRAPRLVAVVQHRHQCPLRQGVGVATLDAADRLLG